MQERNAPLLAALIFLCACRATGPDHTDPRGVPPPPREEISWETFINVPWRDPLHDKYEELFLTRYPGQPRRHFATERPFSDVSKYELAFDSLAVPGGRAEREAGGGEYAVSLHLPGSVDKTVALVAAGGALRLTVEPKAPAKRYRVYRKEETIVPVPAGADPDTARLVRDGDWARIKFNGLDARRPHGK